MPPNTMQALQLTAYKKPLQIHTVPMPTPGDEDVLIAVHAAGINPLDFKIQNGDLKLVLPYRLPITLGHDVAGVVTAVGKNVRRFAVGDAVLARPRDGRIGTFAAHMAVHQDDLAHKPGNISFEDAAGLPLVALTVYQALFDVLKLQPGQMLLVLAGAGGVGTIAIQMAKLAGAHVATTASPAGFELVQSLGADEVINYKTEDFAQKLQGFDAVLDTQGGADLMKAFSILKPGGTVVSLAGMPDKAFAQRAGLGWFKAMLFGLASHSITQRAKKHSAHYHFLFMQANGAQLQTVTDWVQQGRLRPVTDRVFPFSQIHDALAYAQSGRAKGKVVVTFK